MSNFLNRDQNRYFSKLEVKSAEKPIKYFDCWLFMSLPTNVFRLMQHLTLDSLVKGVLLLMRILLIYPGIALIPTLYWDAQLFSSSTLYSLVEFINLLTMHVTSFVYTIVVTCWFIWKYVNGLVITSGIYALCSGFERGL